jgi:Rrf2 family nitric oxide-sensitive transcriptional repressor
MMVRLTLHTDFALRVLIHVGLNDGKQTTITNIAQSFGISKAHLMKVVNDLSQKGYLNTVRGRKGGIRLMREPRHINIGRVVRDTEDQLNVIGCSEHMSRCWSPNHTAPSVQIPPLAIRSSEPSVLVQLAGVIHIGGGAQNRELRTDHKLLSQIPSEILKVWFCGDTI